VSESKQETGKVNKSKITVLEERGEERKAKNRGKIFKRQKGDQVVSLGKGKRPEVRGAPRGQQELLKRLRNWAVSPPSQGTGTLQLKSKKKVQN